MTRRMSYNWKSTCLIHFIIMAEIDKDVFAGDSAIDDSECTGGICRIPEDLNPRDFCDAGGLVEALLNDLFLEEIDPDDSEGLALEEQLLEDLGGISFLETNGKADSYNYDTAFNNLEI